MCFWLHPFSKHSIWIFSLRWNSRSWREKCGSIFMRIKWWVPNPVTVRLVIKSIRQISSNFIVKISRDAKSLNDKIQLVTWTYPYISFIASVFRDLFIQNLLIWAFLRSLIRVTVPSNKICNCLQYILNTYLLNSVCISRLLLVYQA